MTEDAALEILRERRGRMYDPQVVDTFIAIYRTLTVDLPDTPEHRQVLKRISESQAQPRPAPEASQTAQSISVPGDVLAFVSLSRLAKGDVTITDVLALSSNLVGDIVPGATGAWYLSDGTNDRLTVVSAFGPAACLLSGASIAVGERLSGWVAASRQAVFDSDAALDFDGSDEVQPDLQRCTSVPLMLGTTLIGVLSVYSPSGACDPDRGRLLEMIAPHVASALHAARAASSARVEPAALAVAESARERHPTSVH